MIVLYVLLALAAGTAIWVIWTYNTLVRNRNYAEEAWSGIDVQLNRRHDLVPNLIEIAEAYRIHESRVLTEAAKYRSEAMQTDGPAARGAAESRLQDALVRIFAIAEDYPDLRAADVYINLHDEIVSVEEALQLARRYYNGTVRNYNNLVEMFPMNLIARAFAFREAEFFQLEEEAAREVPAVTAV